MKAIFSLIIFLSFCTIQIVAQTQVDYQPLKSAGEIPAEFRSITANKVRKAQAEEKNKNRNYKEKRTVDEFLLRNNYFIDELLNSGKVLFGDPLSEYVNLVADKVMVNDLELRSKLRFYVVKSNEVNAFATNAGIIFITVGLIAQIENEAQLAFVLSHEIAHIEKYHSIETVLEAQKVMERNRRDYAGYDDRIRVLSSFSREKELEADSLGFKRYISAGYDKNAAVTMMDVLQFSFTPFVDVKFDPAILELDSMKFPDKCRLLTPPAIPLSTDETDDSKSTHPNIKKRREMLSAAADRTTGIGENFIIGKSPFEIVRRTARNEMIHLDLIERHYMDALYNAVALNKLAGGGVKYYEEAIGKALYGISKYSNENYEKTIFYDGDEVYDNLAVCNHLLHVLDDSQINLIAIRYLMYLENKYQDAFVTLLLDDLIQDGMDNNSLKLDDITKGLASARSFIEAAKLVKEKPVVVDDEPVAKPVTPVESAEGSKYEKLRIISDSQKKGDSEGDAGKDSVATWNNLFHFMAFSAQDFTALQSRFDLLRAKMDKTKESDQAWAQEATKRKRHYKRRGYSLGLDKVVFVDPAFYSFDKRKGVKLIDSEERLFAFVQQLKDCSEAADLQAEMLFAKNMAQSEVNQYNNLAMLNDWMAERMTHEDKRVEMIPLQTEFTQEVADAFGTDYFCYTGVLTTKMARRGRWSYVLVSLIYWPLLPFSIIRAFTPLRITYTYFMLYNVRTGQTKWVHDKTVKRNAKEGYVNSLVYDTLYQMRRKSK